MLFIIAVVIRHVNHMQHALAIIALRRDHYSSLTNAFSDEILEAAFNVSVQIHLCLCHPLCCAINGINPMYMQ